MTELIMKRGKRKNIIRIVIIVAVVILLGIAVVFGLNMYVKNIGGKRILQANEAVTVKADCILVLGAGVTGSDPSPMLSDRISTAIDLYETGAAPVILMSGDHGTAGYDEVNVMKRCAIDGGVASEKIFMDHAGFSTYDSLYRAAEVFGAKKIIIVSQAYHLYRALYIAEQLGIEAYGVGADLRTYVKQDIRELRELFARDKDVVKCLFRPEPEYLGEKILLTGSGDITND